MYRKLKKDYSMLIFMERYKYLFKDCKQGWKKRKTHKILNEHGFMVSNGTAIQYLRYWRIADDRLKKMGY